MSNTELSLATQYLIEKVEIDGKSVKGIYTNISVHEDLFNPLLWGSITLLDTDTGNFIEENDIEGNEPISLQFTNALGEVFLFEGVLNGLRNKGVKEHKSIYTFDFSSEQLRNNEKKFIHKRFNAPPVEIVTEMVENHLKGKIDKFVGVGLSMNFTGSRRRPLDIITRVLRKGTALDGSSDVSGADKRQGTTRGTSGFLFWQTLDGYRFGSVDATLRGELGKDQGVFTYQLQNNRLTIEDSMESIVAYDLERIGDVQANLRAGAWKTNHISFNMDSGQYTEFVYEDDSNMTDKQKAIVEEFPTRQMFSTYTNEVFENTCQIAQTNYWDQSRLTKQQNNARQQTFNDQAGHFTLHPRYTIRVGDTVEMKIPKVEGERGTGYNEKHSGRYVVSKVGHHFFSDGRSFTKLGTIRSTIQQDDASSRDT